MINQNDSIWIVTDLDGTLLDHQYNMDDAKELIPVLKKNRIPVIPCTSKTAAEVRVIRNQLNLTDPFIVENGAAIYGNNMSFNNEWELVLGKSYVELRTILDSLSKEINYPLVALNDLNNSEIKELTNLNDNQIDLALDRHWSVPFLTPPDIYLEKINNINQKYDVQIFQGNLMSHLLGNGSHKGIAVNKLKEYLDQRNSKVIGLGDSPNDIPLLQISDFPIVIPGKDGPNKALLDGLKGIDFIVADSPHSKGWASSIKDIMCI